MALAYEVDSDEDMEEVLAIMDGLDSTDSALIENNVDVDVPKNDENKDDSNHEDVDDQSSISETKDREGLNGEEDRMFDLVNIQKPEFSLEENISSSLKSLKNILLNQAEVQKNMKEELERSKNSIENTLGLLRKKVGGIASGEDQKAQMKFFEHIFEVFQHVHSIGDMLEDMQFKDGHDIVVELEELLKSKKKIEDVKNKKNEEPKDEGTEKKEDGSSTEQTKEIKDAEKAKTDKERKEKRKRQLQLFNQQQKEKRQAKKAKREEKKRQIEDDQ